MARQTSDGYKRAMSGFLIVFLGAGVGGAARHGVNVTCARVLGVDFPWATPIINVLGSAIMGVLIGYFAFRASGAWSQNLRLFATTGVLGGFTTFSTFSLDAVLLWERGSHAAATLYVLGSVAVAILGLASGLAVVRAIT